jgi:hypothetical protein
MASLSEFSAELREQMEELDGLMQGVATQLDANSREIAAKKEERTALIREAALRLLPDLTAASFARVLAQQPSFMRAEEATSLVASEKDSVRQRLTRLETRFDPAKYDRAKAALELKIATGRDELEKIIQPEFANFEGLASFRIIKRLIAAGYGTGTYRYRWWNSQFYADWREADEAVEEAKYKDWDSLKLAFVTARDNLEAVSGSYEQARADLRALEGLKSQHDELAAEFDRVPQMVLERLQTKLIGQLSGLDPMPNWLHKVADLDVQLAKLEEQNGSLGESRALMTKDMANMRSLRSKATGSGRREVPDKYLETLRTNRNRRSSGGGFGRSGSSSSPVIVYDSGSSFLDGLIFSELMHSFGDSHHHGGDGGYHGGGGFSGGGGGSSRHSIDPTMQS